MDPATLKIVLQLGQALAKSRMFRSVIAAVLLVGVTLAGTAALSSYATTIQVASALRVQQRPVLDGASCEKPLDVISTQGASTGSLSALQVDHAQTIWQVAQKAGAGDHGAVVGIATAMQESTLMNLPGGDRDSVGLFQQRAPWGSFSARHNPGKAAEMFFRGGRGGQPGLDDIRGWREMSVTRAAQTVQVSAYPDAYAKHEKVATGLVARFRSKAPAGSELNVARTTEDCGVNTSTTSIRSKMQAVGGGREAAREACVKLGSNSVFTYVGHQPTMNKAWDCMAVGATGQAIADHMATNREQYGISYIIWNREILRNYDKPGIPAGTWAPYFDGGSSDPSRAHTNHVHTSYY